VVFPGDWTIDFALSAPAAATHTCVVVSFNDGPAGTPVNQQIGPFPNGDSESGAKGPLTIYTHTGPAAVSLQQLSASATSGSPALIAFGLMLLGALTVVAVRRSRV